MKNEKINKELTEIVSDRSSFDDLDARVKMFRDLNLKKEAFYKLKVYMVIVYLIMALFPIYAETKIHNYNNQILFAAFYVIIITILIPAIQPLFSNTIPDKQNSLYLDLISTLLINESNLSEKEKEKAKSVLNKISLIDTPELIPDKDFFDNQRKKSIEEYLEQIKAKSQKE